MTSVLVTGIGAIIGYGIVRSLRESRPDLKIIGSDINDDAVGRIWCDEFVQAPLTATPGYLEWLLKIVRNHAIDLIMPGIEQDVHRLSDDRDLIAHESVRICLNDRSLIDVSRDKWATYQALANVCDDIQIPSFLTGSFDELSKKIGVPFLLKPRRSYASKGLIRVTSSDVFDQHAARLGTELMAQPIVGIDEEEYTTAIFGDGVGGVKASITLKRKLSSEGSTSKAWVRSDNDLDGIIERLAKTFRPVGPTNFQFRRTQDGWKLLEINPRISSSTSIRRAFGYNESLMCLEYFLEGKLPSQPSIRTGFAARYVEDVVIYDRDHF